VTAAVQLLEQNMDPAKLAFQKKLKAVQPLLRRAGKVPDFSDVVDRQLTKCINDAPTNYPAATLNPEALENLARANLGPDKIKERHERAGLQRADVARNNGAALELSARLLDDAGNLNVAVLDEQIQAYATQAAKQAQPAQGWTGGTRG